jgi:hypothetical protein
LGYTEDIIGRTVPQETNPTIGAYEFPVFKGDAVMAQPTQSFVGAGKEILSMAGVFSQPTQYFQGGGLMIPSGGLLTVLSEKFEEA